MEFGVLGLGFGVEDLGFRVQTLGSRVQGSGFKVQGTGLRVQGLEFGVRGVGCRVEGLREHLHASSHASTCRRASLSGPFLPSVEPSLDTLSFLSDVISAIKTSPLLAVLFNMSMRVEATSHCICEIQPC